jgi:hypothetical protein
VHQGIEPSESISGPTRTLIRIAALTLSAPPPARALVTLDIRLKSF